MYHLNSFFNSLLLASIFILSGCSSISIDIPPSETFSNPNDTLEFDNIGKFSGTDTILVPSIYLHLLAKGTYKQSRGGAHAKASFGVANLDEELGLELATEIHDDLVTKLKASGWKVLTYADTQDLAWDKIDKADIEDELGTYGHGHNFGYGKQFWVTFSPDGVPVFDPVTFGLPGTPDVHKIHRKIARKADANLLFPVYRFNSPIPYGETSRGYKKNRAEANVMPGLDFAFADSAQYSVKGAWGYVRLADPLRLSEDIGNLVKVSESSQKDNTLFFGDVFRSISKGGYSMTLDVENYKKAVLQAARDYNSALVAALKPVIDKQ